jgi:hypothetical protein
MLGRSLGMSDKVPGGLTLIYHSNEATSPCRNRTRNSEGEPLLEVIGSAPCTATRLG